jgi:SAM-dependent methyltransferase
MAESATHGHHGEAPARRSDGDAIWLAATWPFIRSQLPPPPARVIELGCGQAGGHIPALVRAGYDATGVDPEAPEGAAYRRAAFEGYRPERPADAVIASVSLHHVDDPGAALDHVADILRPDGAVIVVEWISEDFDGATARWCFGHRLRDADEPGAWLPVLYADWAASGLSWDSYFGDWLGHHGLHPAGVIRRELDARFTVTHLSTAPYYFPDLLDADAAAEQAAIDAGQLRAGCLRYTGRLAGTPLLSGPAALLAGHDGAGRELEGRPGRGNAGNAAEGNARVGGWPGQPGWAWPPCPAATPSPEAPSPEASSPEVASRSRNGPTRCPSWAECRNRLSGSTVYRVRRPLRVRVMYPAASRSATMA